MRKKERLRSMRSESWGCIDGGLRNRNRHDAWAHHACQSPLRSIECRSHPGGLARASAQRAAGKSKPIPSSSERGRRGKRAREKSSAWHSAIAARQTRAFARARICRDPRNSGERTKCSNSGRDAPWMMANNPPQIPPDRARSSGAAKGEWADGWSQLLHLRLQPTVRQPVDWAKLTCRCLAGWTHGRSNWIAAMRSITRSLSRW